MILFLKNNIYKSTVLLLFFRKLHAKFKYLDLIFLPKSKLNKSDSKGEILISTIISGEISPVRFESTLGSKLSMEGYSPQYLICDKVLEACQFFKYNSYPKNINWLAEKSSLKKNLCDSCFFSAKNKLSRVGNTIYLSTLLDNMDISLNQFLQLSSSDLIKFKYNDINVGEEGLAAYLRYYCVSTYSDNSLSHIILAKYVFSAYMMTVALDNYFLSNNTKLVVCNHGVYVPNGVTVRVAKKYSLPVAVWNLSYRKGTFLFSLGDTYHKEMLNDFWWKDFEFTNFHKNTIKTYLASRRTGKQDWVSFQKDDEKLIDLSSISLAAREYEEVYSMLTNVLWDAQIHFEENIFKDMLNWVFYTIDYFIQNPNKLLFIRVHPAEDRGVLPTRQRVVDEVHNRYSNLPKNIIIIDSQSPITSYDCADLSNIILIYGTKMGAEISAQGKPVIVAGEAWVKGKGFTFDPNSIDQYLSMLNQGSSLRLTDEKKLLALKYAYYFFFERCIEIPFFKYRKSYPPFKIPLSLNNVNEIKNDKGLNLIINQLNNYVRNSSN
jgi:hypothetical protein